MLFIEKNKVLVSKADQHVTRESKNIRTKIMKTAEKSEVSNMQPLYTCSSCHWSGDETHFITKILSIMYRPKNENIQAFKQIKCPKCHNLVTIIFETLDGSMAK